MFAVLIHLSEEAATCAAAAQAAMQAALQHAAAAAARLVRPVSVLVITSILDFGGFDSSRILKVRGGILTMSIEDFPDNLHRGILAEMILAGRLGVACSAPAAREAGTAVWTSVLC